MRFHSETPVGIDPRVDVVFKRLFGDPRHPRVLLRFLNDVLAPASPIVHVEVRDSFQASMFEGQKSVVLDIKAEDASGHVFQVEMQRQVDRGLDQRMLYGWGRLYVDQLSAGAPYTTLRPVVSIWICEEDLFPAAKKAHLRFGLTEVDERFALHADIRFEVLQLSRWAREPASVQALPSLPWFWFFGEAEQWREVPPSIDNEALEEAMQILNEFRTDVALNDLYHARLDAERVERGRREHLEEVEADFERERAEKERERAEKERERAEKERAWAEKERERAEKEALAAELAALKAKLGLS